MRQNIKNAWKRIMAMAVVVSLFGSACATLTSNYPPRDSGLVTMSYETGKRVFKRDGKTFEAGIFNQGLVEAVEPNPEALQYAKEGVRISKKSFRWSLLSLVPVLAGGILAPIGKKQGNDVMEGAGLGLMGGGLLLSIINLGFTPKAFANFQDALNKYNDDVLQKTAPAVFSKPTDQNHESKLQPVVKEKQGNGVITVYSGPQKLDS